MAHNPRQAIIDFLSAPVSTPDSAITITSDAKERLGAMYTGGGMGAVADTIRFLKERTVPLHYAALLTFADTNGKMWEFACFARQEGGHTWVFKGGGSVSDKNNGRQPHANLAGGWAEGGFYAGGIVHGNGIEVAHAKIVSVDGLTFEDTVENGRVLFVTDREDIFAPVRVLLYDAAGVVVNSHIGFGV